MKEDKELGDEFRSEDIEDLISVRDAAALLQVSPSTLWRWIDQGIVSAYRLGRKRVCLRRGELKTLVKPANLAGQQIAAKAAGLRLVPMSPHSLGLGALGPARELRAEMLARRGGRPLPDSTDDINAAREERSAEL